MLDRLTGQEQAPGDLRAGEAFTEEGKHLLLTLGEQAEVPGASPRSPHAEVSRQCGSGVRAAVRPQVLAAVSAVRSPTPGHLRVAWPDCLGEQQPRLRGARGNPGLDERR
jgi:hypothetical protein